MGVQLPFRRFNSQPTSLDGVALNRQHPSVAGLRVATFAADGCVFVNVASGTRAVDPYPETSFVRSTVSAQGRSRSTTGGSYRNQFYPPPSTARGKQTLLVLFRPKIASGAGSLWIASAGESSGSWNMAEITFGPSNNINASCVNGTTITSDSPLTIGNDCAVAFTNDGPNSAQRLFVNGVKQSGTSSYGGNASKMLDVALIGSNNGADDAIGYYAAFVWDRVLSDAEIAELSRNPYPLFAKRNSATPRLSLVTSAAATLAGNAACQAVATGALSTSIPLAGTASGSATASGSLTTGIRLTGTASSSSTASGSLSTSIALAGTAPGSVVASGSLATGICLAGTAACGSTASGSLTTAITLAGVAAVSSSASGSLSASTTANSLAGAALCSSSAGGSLSTSITLAGVMATQSSTAGALTTGITLAGAALCGSSAGGSLSTSITLAGVVAIQSSAIGTLTTGIALTGICLVGASASGSLTAIPRVLPISTEVDLGRALRKSIQDCAIGIPIALENSPFEKPAGGTPWAKLSTSRGNPVPVSMGPHGLDECQGQVLLELNFPLFTGTAAIAAVEQQLADFFELGKSLTYNYTAVTVLSCGRVRDTEVDGYFQRTIAISWQAYIDRPR